MWAFGIIASPFLAICTTQEHVQRNKEQYPEACEGIIKNTYADDFAFCRDDVNEAVELQKSAKELMEKTAFYLTKWSSNSKELLDVIPEEDRTSSNLISLNQESRDVTLQRHLFSNGRQAKIHSHSLLKWIVHRMSEHQETGGFASSQGFLSNWINNTIYCKVKDAVAEFVDARHRVGQGHSYRMM